MSGLLLWLALGPLAAAAGAERIPAGAIPAGALFPAIARLAERPVYPESPIVGHRLVHLERDLVIRIESLPAMQSLLLDAGVALVELDPGRPRQGWIATTRTEGARRPLSLAVRVIHLDRADPVEVAELLNARAEEEEKDLPPGDIPTRFVPDPRTGAVIARYTSADRLRVYLELAEELDQPGRDEGLILRVYRPQYLRAQSLLPIFEAAWDDRGGYAIRVVAPENQNLLIFRCPPQVWEDAESLIRRLDREPPRRTADPSGL